MTQMLYRPQTKDKKHCGLPIIKTIFKTLPVDAIVVEEIDTDVYFAKGWFAHPSEMKKDDTSKRSNRRGTKKT